MRGIGLDQLCGFGMKPTEFVALAADLGCVSVSTTLARAGTLNPHAFPDWSLREDAALRRETMAACRDRGIRLALVEGFFVAPSTDVRALAPDLDVAAELGAERIACVSVDQDLRRTIDEYAVLAEMGAARGLLVSAEMGSLGPYGRTEQALAVFAGVAQPSFTLLLDAMHFFRLGNTAEQLDRFPPDAIGYAQLCDAPWAARFDTYIEEAMYERMVPGEGELPLAEFVRRLPKDVPISLEIPLRSLAQAGIGPRERLRPCVAAARALLSAADS